MIRTGASRLLIAESAAVALAIAFIARSTGARFMLCITCVALVAVAVGQWRGRPLTWWLATAARWVARARIIRPIPVQFTGTSLADPQGTLAIFELGDTHSLITTAPIPLPHVDIGRSPGPTVAAQLVVLVSPPRRRALLAVRVGGDGVSWSPETLLSTLECAAQRISRRLDTRLISHDRLAGADLAVVASVPLGVREGWAHVDSSAGVQATLRATLGSPGMTSPLLAQLADAATSIAITWTHATATLRVTAASKADLERTIEKIRMIVPAIRLDGEHRDGLRATLPIAWPGRTTSSRSTERVSTEGLSMRPSGMLIGHDRGGEAVRLQIPTDRDEPPRVCVVGGTRAARLLAARATRAGIRVTSPQALPGGGRSGWAAGGVRSIQSTTGIGGASALDQGVPLVLDVVEHPSPADAPTLAAADIVICHPVSAGAATIVTEALGLSPRVAGWLGQIEGEMIALVGEGAVRWVMLAAE